MSAIGTFIKFIKVESTYPSDDLMHGKVISVGELVKLPIKKGQIVVVSTVKRNQDVQDGVTFYYVDEKQVMDVLK